MTFKKMSTKLDATLAIRYAKLFSCYGLCPRCLFFRGFAPNPHPRFFKFWICHSMLVKASTCICINSISYGVLTNFGAFIVILDKSILPWTSTRHQIWQKSWYLAPQKLRYLLAQCFPSITDNFKCHLITLLVHIYQFCHIATVSACDSAVTGNFVCNIITSFTNKLITA